MPLRFRNVSLKPHAVSRVKQGGAVHACQVVLGNLKATLRSTILPVPQHSIRVGAQVDATIQSQGPSKDRVEQERRVLRWQPRVNGERPLVHKCSVEALPARWNAQGGRTEDHLQKGIVAEDCLQTRSLEFRHTLHQDDVGRCGPAPVAPRQARHCGWVNPSQLRAKVRKRRCK